MNEKSPSIKLSFPADYSIPSSQEILKKDLGFGNFFAPIQLKGEWSEKSGWDKFEVGPLTNFSLHPSAAILQYAQTIFEGMKAFRGVDGNIRLYRSEFHAERFKLSAERLCMPPLETQTFVELVEEIVKQNHTWVPTQVGQSLYIRPTMMGTESFLGVRPSKEVTFFIFASPVGNYYSKGAKDLRILIETEDVRAAQGGLGWAKTGANYAASLRAGERAKKVGFDQVLWLDGRDRKFIEEVGTMNIFFVLKDKIVTPALNGSILNGCTRSSVLTILREKSIPVEERAISLEELQAAAQKGELKEIFGTGTAAVIAPVAELSSLKGEISIRPTGDKTISSMLQETITGIQFGSAADTRKWTSLLAI